MSESTTSIETQSVAQVTALLRELAANYPHALPKLMAAVQHDLRHIAHHERLAVRAGDTLSTTALINEVYLKLGHAELPAFENRRLFFNVAARAMRQVLIDYARAQMTEKRGNGIAAESLDAADDLGNNAFEAEQAIELNDAVDQLEQVSPRLSQMVQLRFYAGLTESEIGDLLEIDERTVRRDWVKARGWLFEYLNPDNRQN